MALPPPAGSFVVVLLGVMTLVVLLLLIVLFLLMLLLLLLLLPPRRRSLVAVVPVIVVFVILVVPPPSLNRRCLPQRLRDMAVVPVSSTLFVRPVDALHDIVYFVVSVSVSASDLLRRASLPALRELTVEATNAPHQRRLDVSRTGEIAVLRRGARAAARAAAGAARRRRGAPAGMLLCTLRTLRRAGRHRRGRWAGDAVRRRGGARQHGDDDGRWDRD